MQHLPTNTHRFSHMSTHLFGCHVVGHHRQQGFGHLGVRGQLLSPLLLLGVRRQRLRLLLVGLLLLLLFKLLLNLLAAK